MVVRYLRGEARQMQRLRHIPRQPRRGRDPHGAAVAVAVIGLRVVRVQPPAEAQAVAAVRVCAAKPLHMAHQRRFDGGVILPARFQQSLRHG